MAALRAKSVARHDRVGGPRSFCRCNVPVATRRSAPEPCTSFYGHVAIGAPGACRRATDVWNVRLPLPSRTQSLPEPEHGLRTALPCLLRPLWFSGLRSRCSLRAQGIGHAFALV
jgi:hypothetical protein